MAKISKKVEMIKNIKKFISDNNLDGYIIPKNDEFFTEYSKINKLEIVANFSGSAGFILILKNSNHLFVDGRYTIQAKKQSGKKFKIHEIPYEWPKDILKNDARLNIGFDPKLFTTETLKIYFNNSCNLFPVNSNLFKTKVEIINKDNLIYQLNTSIVGESSSKVKGQRQAGHLWATAFHSENCPAEVKSPGKRSSSSSIICMMVLAVKTKLRRSGLTCCSWQ